MSRSSILRHSSSDSYLIGLSFLHPLLLWIFPSPLTVGLGVWWNSNTISHHFLHLPFFRSTGMNRAYSLYLTVLLGIPQSLWKRRHLAHHRAVTQWSSTGMLTVEVSLVLLFWAFLGFINYRFLFLTYLPGYALGLVLCFVHGYFEHARGTTSNYGLMYNMAFFNDGYHAEHHERPATHWTKMPQVRSHGAQISRWPAILRWLDLLSLETLERLALRFRPFQILLLRSHERAFRKLLPYLPPIRNVVVIGGGMYPRTALVLLKLFPGVQVRILDSKASHLEIARGFLDDPNVCFQECHYVSGSPGECDLLILPLSFQGSRETIYADPPVSAVLVHDWIWARREISVVVSFLLLKRINLILR